MPWSRRARMPSRMARRLCGSMPTVGSSRYSTRGLCSSATPMFTRRFMPPENFSTRSCWRSSRLMSSQHLVHAALELVAGQAVHAAPEHQVLARRHVRVHGDVLRHHADHGLHGQRRRDHGVAVYERVAGRGPQQAAQHADGGALAGAVGAQQAEDLALVDAEADVGHGQHALGRVVLLAKVPHLDDAHRPPPLLAVVFLYNERGATVT